MKLIKGIILSLVMIASLSGCFEKVEIEGVIKAQEQVLPMLIDKNISWLEQQVSDGVWDYNKHENTLSFSSQLRIDHDEVFPLIVTFTNASDLLDNEIRTHDYSLVILAPGGEVGQIEIKASISKNRIASIKASPLLRPDVVIPKAGQAEYLSFFSTAFPRALLKGELEKNWLHNLSKIKQATYSSKTYGDLCSLSKECTADYNIHDDHLFIRMNDMKGGKINGIVVSVYKVAESVLNNSPEKVTMKEMVLLNSVINNKGETVEFFDTLITYPLVPENTQLTTYAITSPNYEKSLDKTSLISNFLEPSYKAIYGMDSSQ